MAVFTLGDVDVAFVHAFDDNLTILAQQEDAVIANTVRQKTGVVGKTYNFELLGAVTLTTVTTRHQPTPILTPPHGRRRCFFTDKAGAILLDDFDEIKMLISPQSAYAKILANSRNRTADQIIIDALPAAATQVGADDTTSTTTLAQAVTDSGTGAQVIANGSANLTMTKIRQASRILNVNNIPQSDRYFVYSPQGMEKLLSDSTVTSSDFSTIRALMSGGFGMDEMWMGFKWRMSTLLPKTGNIRSCYAYWKEAVGYAVALMGQPEIDKRADLNNSVQVLLKYSAGATRIQDAGVVQVDIDESA